VGNSSFACGEIEVMTSKVQIFVEGVVISFLYPLDSWKNSNSFFYGVN